MGASGRAAAIRPSGRPRRDRQAQRASRSGPRRPGEPGLRNRIYRGEIVHKDKSYPGEHAAIVDLGLWDKVQKMLASNRVERNNCGGAKEPSLLAGLIFDDGG